MANRNQGIDATDSVKGCFGYQAIVTRWLAPTNHRGSRVKAWCEAGSVTVGWNYSLEVHENHAAAALALATKLEWDGEWRGGSAPEKGCRVAYVFVRSGGRGFTVGGAA